MVSSIKAVEEANRLQSFNYNRYIRKLKRLENLEENNEFLSEVSENELDNKQSNDGNAVDFENHVNKYILKDIDFSQKVKESTLLDINTVENFVSKYVVEMDAEILWDYVDEEDMPKEKVDKLFNDINTSDDELGEKMLDSFFKGNPKLSIPQIYAILYYLYNELNKKSKKLQMLKLIKELLSTLESQNSNLLFEFFDLANHSSLKGNIKLISKLVNFSSGDINLGNLKQVLGFISDKLSGEFENLVSNSLKIRSQILRELKDGKNFENLTELSLYLRFEKNLICINSLYHKMINFKEYIKENKCLELNLSDDYCGILNGVFTFTEAGLVNDFMLGSLFKSMGLELKMEKSQSFLPQLQRLIAGLPLPLFKDQLTQKQKLVEGIRNYSKNVATKKETRKFEFIKPQKINIKLV